MIAFHLWKTEDFGFCLLCKLRTEELSRKKDAEREREQEMRLMRLNDEAATARNKMRYDQQMRTQLKSLKEEAEIKPDQKVLS